MRCRRTPSCFSAERVGRLRKPLVAVAVTLAVAAAIAPAAPSATRRIVIGRSVEGRPIVAWTFGPDRAKRKILVVGCIHGDECAGLAITTALRGRRVAGDAQLWVVPELNPDGTAAGTRQNADGVDLNRNFPYRWSPITDPVFDSGPHAASEPETRAAISLVRRIKPAVSIWYHQHQNLVDLSGGGDRGVARRYARVSGLRSTCLTFLTGIEGAWSNHLLPGTTSFVVELPAGPVSGAALPRHLNAVRAMELGQRSGSATRCESVTPAG
jgi:hypothetical protein